VAGAASSGLLPKSGRSYTRDHLARRRCGDCGRTAWHICAIDLRSVQVKNHSIIEEIREVEDTGGKGIGRSDEPRAKIIRNRAGVELRHQTRAGTRRGIQFIANHRRTLDPNAVRKGAVHVGDVIGAAPGGSYLVVRFEPVPRFAVRDQIRQRGWSRRQFVLIMPIPIWLFAAIILVCCRHSLILQST